jgi:hypothetical protein
MGRKILIDTNIAIGYIGNRLSLQSMDKLNGLDVLTHNTKDFENIVGLKVYQPDTL